MKGMSDRADFWYIDMNLFAYEYATALLCRMLQLSIPDQNTAIAVSIIGALAEMGVRVFYFIFFLRDGMKKEGDWLNADEVFAYALRGKLRVADSSNDTIVEYLSSISAAIFLVELQSTGAFSFASTTAIPPSTIYFLVFVQLAPELFLDWFVTFLEVWGGLSVVHEAHWNRSTGAYPKSHPNFYYRQGDLVKSTILKLPAAIFMATLALIACTN